MAGGVRGAVVEPLRPAVGSQARGTRLTFRLDLELFGPASLEPCRSCSTSAVCSAAWVWPEAQRVAPALELVLTEILERYPTPAWHARWGFLDAHGAMLAGLAAPLVVETGRDGTWWRVVCVRGAVVEPLCSAVSPQVRGTRITFRPDPALFATHRFDPARLAAGLAAIRAAVPGVDVRLVRA